jgi:hypothetical protein
MYIVHVRKRIGISANQPDIMANLSTRLILLMNSSRRRILLVKLWMRWNLLRYLVIQRSHLNHTLSLDLLALKPEGICS